MVKLRNSSLSDLERVREIDRISFPDRVPYSKKFLKGLFQNYPQGIVVVEKNKKIIGYTIGRPKNSRAEIVSLAVEPDWQKRGIGTALTKFLIERFQKEEVKEAFLYVRTKNKQAISFYQELGFKVAKTLENFYRNGDNAYLMTKELKRALGAVG
jgi:ribosomal-protein-alanine N-acetyltransferase